MSDLTERLLQIEQILASATTFDHTVMDRTQTVLYGINLTALDPKHYRKMKKAILGVLGVNARYPDSADPKKPLPATALVELAYWLQQMRMLAQD